MSTASKMLKDCHAFPVGLKLKYAKCNGRLETGMTLQQCLIKPAYSYSIKALLP